jgi:hypothetical protein
MGAEKKYCDREIVYDELFKNLSIERNAISLADNIPFIPINISNRIVLINIFYHLILLYHYL